MNNIFVKDITEFLISQKIEFQLKGNETVWVDDFSSLDSLTDRKVSWVKSWTEDSIKKLEKKKETIIIGCLTDAIEPGEKNCFILCEDPKMCFFEVLNRFFVKKDKSEIAKTAVIHTCNIGKNCSIGEYSVIDDRVVLGDNVKIGNHVILQGKVIIGDNSVIESGTVIGKNGFGFYHDSAGHMKRVPHLGGVIIGKYVEIGTYTCIDCGTMNDTIIGDYSKIDNLCHIAHNVNIGKDVMVIAGCIICGSCKIEDGCYIAPNASVKNQIKIGSNAFVGMQTLVLKDVNDGESVRGVPGETYDRKYKI